MSSTPKRFEFKKPARTPNSGKDRVSHRDPNLVSNWLFQAEDAAQPRLYFKFNGAAEAKEMLTRINEALPIETSALIYTVEMKKDEDRVSTTVFAPLAVQQIRDTA